MQIEFNLAHQLDAILNEAASKAGMDASCFKAEVRTADPIHGDYQANGVLGYAKQNKLNPRAVATTLVASLPQDLNEHCDIQIAGPGFINFKLKPKALSAWLLNYGSLDALKAGASINKKNERCVIDFGGPNTAKQMHVGHVRSSVIGHALSRILAFNGATVITDNHLGDWGTQFGKLIYAYKRWVNLEAMQAEPIEELERLYKLGSAATPENSPELEEARLELVKLQQGDPENVALWKKFTDISLIAFQKIYDQLGIHFDHTLGESFYNDKLAPVYSELLKHHIAEESKGALVVFHPEHPRFKTQPFIIRKSDGAANYATTDLATLLYRVETFHATSIIYVVDKRQSDHFEQLFLTAKAWFSKTNRTLPTLNHVDFGTVLGENGTPLKTREGDNIKLQDLLNEAKQRAYTLVSERSPDFSEEERREISTVVGIGSVQYADLSQNRSSDYVFSWDKMISLEGNTAAYLLYAAARIHSIFRKNSISIDVSELSKQASVLETPTEIALARKLIGFSDAIRLAGDTLRPHFLCLYLYELAGAFSAFYTADKVLVEDSAVRSRRLVLCSRTLLFLETGLNLLGLRTLKRM
jgi:arginyl-tRNA synthetase